MSQRIHAFLNKSLKNRTGELGSVKDFLFDDHHWGVRYLVVRAGSWLTGREVLISPDALEVSVAGEDDSLPVNLTEEQVRDAPGIDASRPVSRQQENDLRLHYGWPLYWTDPYYMTLGTGVGNPVPPAAMMVEEPVAREDEPDLHLRSVKEVTGYTILARDGELGHVEDFVVDGERWLLTHLVVDTRNWLPGRKVVLPVRAILAVNWAESQVEINLTREDIEKAPEYDEEGGELALHTRALGDYYKGLH
ncbi:MAG: PRC-barrel domain-containing protein [Verrucomicrobiota bacterium]